MATPWRHPYVPRRSAITTPAGATSGAQTLAEQWNRSSWSTMTTQSPGSNANDLYNNLIGVSCKPPSFCVAAGSHVGTSSGQTLAETYGNPFGVWL